MRTVRALAFAATLFASALPARAAVVLQHSFEEMTSRAELVVSGQVQTSQSRWEGARIMTFTQVRVLERLKGKSADTITVRQPGGEAGGLAQRVPGAAKFSPGEQVVLFLQKQKNGNAFLLLGMGAAKVSLQANPDGQTQAVRDLRGIAFVQPSSAARPTLQVLDSERLGTGEAFLDRIRRAARSPGSGVGK